MNQPHGIPTTYNGIQMRSRLEARWAAFFDLMGWKWAYEQCDFRGWIPDFELTLDGLTLFVEVKPYREPSADEIRTMLGSVRDATLPMGSALALAGLEPSHLWVITADGRPWPVLDEKRVLEIAPKWVQAGNLVQWKAA